MTSSAHLPDPSARPARLLFGARLYDALLLAVLAAASIEFAVLRIHYGFEDHDATFQHLIDGVAPTPFQYRMLIPLIVRALLAVGAAVHVHIPVRALFVASDAVFCFASFVVALATLKTLKLQPPQILAALLGLAWIIDTNYFATESLNLLHVYDLPAVFFAFLETHLLLKRRLLGFYLVLPFALLNRETAVFLCLLFLVTNLGRTSLPKLAGHMVLQGLVVLAIKAAVMWAFRHNRGPGGLSFYTTDFNVTGPVHQLHDLRILENLRIFASPRRLLHMSSVFGFLWAPYLSALRAVDSTFFKAAAWVFPPFFALMWVVGNLDEFRIYSELIPLLFFTVAMAWSQWIGRSPPNAS